MEETGTIHHQPAEKPMRDTSASCQLELFSEPETAVPTKTPAPAGRLSLPILPVCVRVPENPPAPPTIPDFCREDSLTALAIRLVEGLGLHSISGRISVRWNARMRTAAGRAFYESARIELNPALLAAAGPAEVDRTLRHELAHLVAHHRAGRRRIEPHGVEWRQACADLGIPDEARCHTLPFEARRLTKKLAYECPACGSQILRVRRFRHAVACYECCRRHTGGRFDERYRLRASRLPIF